MPALDGNGHPLLPHKFPGSGGTPTPKPKPPKDPARDKPSDPGHGTPPVSGGGTGGSGQGGTGGPVHDSPSDPGHGTNPVTGHPYKPPAWVVRRQQVLRRAGFGVAVDGVWGPASQRAWANFLHGIRGQAAAFLHSDQLPPGMVRVDGVVMTKGQAKTARLISRAEQSSAQLLHQQKLGQAVHQAQLDAERAHSFARVAANRIAHGQPAPAGTPPAVARRAEEKQAIREYIAQQNDEVANTIQRISGVSDTFIKGNPDWLEQRARAGAVKLHDVVLLDHHGWIDWTDASDVRAVQATINHDSHQHVQLTGQYDQQTDAALKTAWAHQVAKDWRAAVHETQQRFYKTGIAQPVLQHVLGRQLDAAQLTKLLQVGGPKADRVVAALGQAYVQDRRDHALLSLQRTRANQLGGQSFLPFLPQSDQDRLFALLRGSGQDVALALSKSWPELARREMAWQKKVQQEQVKQANSSSSWWGTALGAAGTVLHPLTIPVHKVEEVVFALDAERQSLGILSFSGRSLTAATLGQTDHSDRRGFISWHEAVIRGQATYADLPGWQGFLADTILDPLTYLGPGVIKAAFHGGLEVGYRASLRAADFLDHAEPIIGASNAEFLSSRSFNIASDFLVARAGRPILGGRGFIGGQMAARLPGVNERWIKLTTTRAKAMQEVTKTVRQGLTTALRPVVERELLKQLDEKIGQGAIDRAAEMDGYFDPEFLDQATQQAQSHADALVAVAPDLVQSMAEKLPTSLYAFAGRRGNVLSFTGRRIEARLLDAASRAIVARYAILTDLGERGFTEQLADLRRLPLDILKAFHTQRFGDKELKKLLRRTGAWGKQNVPFDYIDQFEAELHTFTELLHRQILPTLDAKLLEAHGLELFDPLTGRLVNEAGSDIERALDVFFGIDVKAAYEETVQITNENYGRVFSQADRDRIIQGQISAATSSARSYAEMQIRLTGEEEKWTAWADTKIAKAAKDAQVGWKRVDGGWTDLRQTIRVPKAVARGYELDGSTAAFRQAAQLSEATIDSAHIFDVADNLATTVKNGHIVTRPTSPLNSVAVKDVVLAEMQRLSDSGWRRYATESYRLQATHAMAENQVAHRAYRDNFLLMQALKTSQKRIARAGYHALVGSLYLWKAAVLPFSPAFFVRNQIDNWTKAFISGLHDPRLFFNADGDSIFEKGLVREMMGAAAYFDGIHGTAVSMQLEGIVDHFWLQQPETVEKILGLHGITAPKEFLDVARTIKGSFGREASDEAGRAADLLLRTEQGQGRRLVEKWIDTVWDRMAARPENYAKRALYVSEYRKGLARGLEPAKAEEAAVDLVHKTLFDYEQITVAEENLKVFFPFIFFWRNNAAFWARQAWEKPWFYPVLDRVYEGHENSNTDSEPSWMRRYFNLGPVADLSEAAGYGFLAPFLRNAQVDPLSSVSIASFYRAFKSDNPLLPDDKKGSWAFVSSLVDGFQGFGLGVNPLLTAPLSRAGFLNRRAWRNTFPQTTFIQSLTDLPWIRRTLGVDTPGGFNIEDFIADPLYDRVLGYLGDNQPSDDQLNTQRWNELIGQEIAYQQLRGDKADPAAAESKVRSMTVFSNLVGFFLGTYPRMITPEAMALSQIREQLATTPDANFDQAWYGLTPEQQTAVSTFKLAKGGLYSPRAIAHAAELMVGKQAWAAIDDPAERDRFLRDNPDVAAYVNPILSGHQPSEEWLRTQLLSTDTDAVLTFTDHYLKGIDAAPDVLNEAFAKLVTPRLKAFWAKNDTTAELRARHTAAGYFHYIGQINDTYHAIPESDFEARQGFLDRHPELQDWWAANDGASDDYRSVMLSANSSFRTIYFNLVERSGFDAADEFLRRHPFIFDFTSAEGRVTPDGQWIPRSQWQRDYAKVAELERVYYALPKHARASYLEAHPNLRRFWAKYGSKGQVRPTAQAGGLSQHAADYLKIKPLLDRYFSLSDAAKAAFLTTHPELRDYFAKYSSERTQSQHARDYLAVKPEMDAFFNLPESERSAYLAKHPDLQAYFDKYSSGKNGTTGHSYASAVRESLAEHPDIAARYHFWMRFFALPPDQRAEFIHKHAADAGIFIYGSLSYDQRQLAESHWHRQAVALGQSDKAFLYVMVAPLLDIYFKLPKGSAERGLFLQMNPEVKTYLDRYATNPISDPHIAKLTKQYFAIEPFSSGRSDFLDAHPELRAYFNRNPSKREAALQRQIDAFFQIPFGPARDEYAAQHPELKHYFDQRAAEAQLYTDLSAAFNADDPRMRKFYEMYADIVPLDAMRLAWLRAQSKHEIIQQAARIDRAAARTPDELRRIDRAGTDANLT